MLVDSIGWLLGNTNISKSHEYKIKSEIRKKLKIFLNLELPLIQKNGLHSIDLTTFDKNLTVFGKQNCSLNSSNNQC